MRRYFLTAIFVLAAMLPTFILGQAQQTAPASDVVIGSGSFSPIVADLEKSLAFYSDLLGAMMPANIPAWGAESSLVNFLGVPDGQVRVGNVRIPGSTMRVEIVDFKDIERKPVQPRAQDPGAVRLILIVRNIDALLAQLKSKSVPVVTVGGNPVRINTPTAKGRAVMVKDPDGHFVELLQPESLPETTAPADSNVIDGGFGLTIADTEQTVHVYKDLLGFQPDVAPAFVSDKATADLMGAPGAQVRVSTAVVPGSRLVVEFVEFKGVDRKPIGARIQDPGSTRLQLRVRDTDAAVQRLKSAGGLVVTTGGNGGPIDMQGLRVALVREVNNLFLVTFTQAQPPARGR